MITPLKYRVAGLLSSVMAAGLLLAGPVLAQEAPEPSGGSPQAVAVAFNDPDRPLTNREAAVMLAGALGVTDAVWQGLFSDVGRAADDAETIEALALAGVVKGNLDGTFRPDEVISRGTFALWLAAGFLADGLPPEPVEFTDVPEEAAYADAVQHLYAAGITLGCSDDPMMFCGEDDLTVWQGETLLERGVARPYFLSGCEDPGPWLLLCDVHEYIETSYVLEVTTEELAAPVAEALGQVVEEAGEDGPTRSRFDCSIPDPLFEPACEWARLAPETPITQVAESVVRELVRGLDRNSAYHDPEEWEAIEESGRYVGIGVRVVTVDDQWQAGCAPLSATCRIFILTVFEGGPAHAAGIQRGDFIVAVDGERLDGITLADAAGIIRGEVDTSVDITIERYGAEHRLTLIRQEIIVPYTGAAFHDTESIAYIEFTSFSSYPGGAVEEFRERLEAAAGYELLILDLRNNGGGSVAVLQGIAGLLVGEIPVMTFHTVEESYDVDGEGEPLVGADAPRIVVLVNGYSASASEVLAGLLHETGRAVVMGETTYKKNTGQSLYDLHNEGVFRLTTIRWTTPGGIDIGESGVPLDIEVEFPNTDLRSLMEWVKATLANPPEQTPEETTPEETTPEETPEE